MHWISKHGADVLFWGCFAAAIVFVFVGLNNKEMQSNYLLAAVICGAASLTVYASEEPES